MQRFTVGDRVCVDTPDESDPDYDRYHDEQGTVVEILEDDAGEVRGDEREGVIFRVEMEGCETFDFRWRDLRPPR